VSPGATSYRFNSGTGCLGGRGFGTVRRRHYFLPADLGVPGWSENGEFSFMMTLRFSTAWPAKNETPVSGPACLFIRKL
jgi:hypothetical protein